MHSQRRILYVSNILQMILGIQYLLRPDVVHEPDGAAGVLLIIGRENITYSKIWNSQYTLYNSQIP